MKMKNIESMSPEDYYRIFYTLKKRYSLEQRICVKIDNEDTMIRTHMNMMLANETINESDIIVHRFTIPDIRECESILYTPPEIYQDDSMLIPKTYGSVRFRFAKNDLGTVKQVPYIRYLEAMVGDETHYTLSKDNPVFITVHGKTEKYPLSNDVLHFKTLREKDTYIVRNFIENSYDPTISHNRLKFDFIEAVNKILTF